MIATLAFLFATLATGHLIAARSRSGATSAKLAMAAFLVCCIWCSATARSYSSDVKPVATEVIGNWAGVLPFSDGYQYVVLGIQASADGNCAATLTYPRLSESSTPASSTICAGDHVDLNGLAGANSFELMADAYQAKMSGSVRIGDRRTQVVMLPARSSPRKELLTYCGDFEDATGDSVVFAESLGVLYYFDRRTGRTGRLFPLEQGHFYGGPMWLIYQPTDVVVAFSSTSSGAAQRASLTISGRRMNLVRHDIAVTTDVHFAAPEATIAGTLSAPPGSGPFPAVLIISGSNGQPRSGYYAENAFIADQFARLGMAVLTFDKRGVGDSTGAGGDNGAEYVAAAAFKFLRSQRAVDPNRVGIWGLSQGGIVAPKVATIVAGVQFIISLSGSVVDSNTQEIERTAGEMRADGFSVSDVAEAVSLQKLKFQYAQTGEGWDQYIAAYERDKGEPWFPDPYVGPPSSRSSSAWAFWHETGAIAPTQYWRTYRGPVLLAYGEHEILSDPDEDTSLFVAAMHEAGNNKYSILRIPGAEHSMLRATTGGPKEVRTLTSYALSYFESLGPWLRMYHFIDEIPQVARYP